MSKSKQDKAPLKINVKDENGKRKKKIIVLYDIEKKTRLDDFEIRPK